MYFGTQYISLTVLDMQYFARIIHVVEQQLRNYTLAFPDVLCYVASSATSVTYVEPVPNATEHIDDVQLFEEFVTLV